MTISLPPKVQVNALMVSGLACFFAGGLYGWSALIAPLQRTFSVSAADAGLAFSLAIVSFTLAVILVPAAFEGRASTRQIALFSMIGGLCVFLAIRAPSYLLFLIWFSGGFGAMSGAIYIVALAIAAGSDHYRAAAPIVVACFGAGGAVFGPLWRVLNDTGWGLDGLHFLLAGLIVGGVLAWITNFQVAPPSEGVKADAASPVLKNGQPTPATCLVLIWLIFALGSYSGLMVLGMAAKMMDAGGIAMSLAGMTLAGIAVCNTVGRLSVAWLVTSLGIGGCLALSGAATAGGLGVMILTNGGAGAVSAGLLLIAAGYGLMAATAPVITRAVFGPAAFQRRFSVVFTAWCTAGFVAPWVAGALYDATGTFDMALLSACAAAVLFGGVGWVLMRRI